MSVYEMFCVMQSTSDSTRTFRAKCLSDEALALAVCGIYIFNQRCHQKAQVREAFSFQTRRASAFVRRPLLFATADFLALHAAPKRVGGEGEVLLVP